MSGWTERNRAESFGDEAELYDRARPSYPDQLVSDLTSGLVLEVLDVGCGTGKAARALAARGSHVLGLEIDPRMAAVARASGVAVELSSFETWDPQGRSFDLVTAGQAWHWLDPALAPARAASVLRTGGRLAPFWNYQDQIGGDLQAAIQQVYRRVVPEFTRDQRLAGNFDRSAEIAQHVEAIDESGRFAACEVRRYPWREHLSRAAWLDRQTTQSDHHLLDGRRRSELMAGIGEVIDRFGNGIDVGYTTYCIVAAVS